MYRTIFRYLTVTSLIFVTILALAACGGAAEEEAPAEVELSGTEWVQKMTEAVKATNTASFTAEFQTATAEGALKGTVNFWGERPSKMRAEVSSEDPDLNGMVAVTNEEKGWAYVPSENFVLTADSSQYKAQLNEEPELRQIIDSGESIVDSGFNEANEAKVLGSEDIDGHATQKVEVKYDQAANPELEGVTTIYYIDKENFLPRRIEISIDAKDAAASGFVMIKDLSTGEAIAADKFTFEPPAGATVMDLNEIIPPDFSSSVSN